MDPITALALVSNAVKLALAITNAVHDAKLVEFGAGMEIKASLEAGLAAIAAANKAAAMANTPEEVAHDPNRVDPNAS